MRYFISFLFAGLFCLPNYLSAQTIPDRDQGWGFKSGLTLGTQRTANSGSTDPLISYNAAFFWDVTLPEAKTGYFFDLGYHRKGSAYFINRTTYLNANNEVVELPARTISNVFHNFSGVLGAKKRTNINDKLNLFYMMGIHGDITALSKFSLFGAQTQKEYVNLGTYGISAGGGLEIFWDQWKDLIVELAIHPDVSPQVFVPAGVYYNPNTRQNTNIPERKTYNTAIELTIGIRFKSGEHDYYEEDVFEAEEEEEEE